MPLIQLSIPYVLIATVIAAAGGYWMGYSKGMTRGVEQTQARYNARQVQELTQALKGVVADAQAAAAASNQIRVGLARLEQTQNASTLELKNALHENAADPVLCRFDDDSMRIIEVARTRAAASAASGIDRALPAARDTDR